MHRLRKTSRLKSITASSVILSDIFCENHHDPYGISLYPSLFCFHFSLSLSLSFSLSPSLFNFLFLFPFLRSSFLFSIWSKDIERTKLTSNGLRTDTLIYCLSHLNLTFVFQKWYSGSCTWWMAIVRNLIFSLKILD